MKFLCLGCDERMDFAQRDVPGDGTMAAVFECGGCGRAVAMLTNPMETQLVSSLGVKVGGREVPAEPMEQTRASVIGERDAALESRGRGAGTATGSGGGETGPAPPPRPVDPTDAGADGGAAVTWSGEAEERLDRVPGFVRGMVRRIYTDYAKERGIETITPGIMDRARSDLGLEGM